MPSNWPIAVSTCTRGIAPNEARAVARRAGTASAARPRRAVDRRAARSRGPGGCRSPSQGWRRAGSMLVSRNSSNSSRRRARALTRIAASTAAGGANAVASIASRSPRRRTVQVSSSASASAPWSSRRSSKRWSPSAVASSGCRSRSSSRTDRASRSNSVSGAAVLIPRLHRPRMPAVKRRDSSGRLARLQRQQTCPPATMFADTGTPPVGKPPSASANMPAGHLVS